MNDILIGLVLFCFIVFMFHIEKKNKNDLIKKILINNITNITNNTDTDADTDTDTDTDTDLYSDDKLG